MIVFRLVYSVYDPCGDSKIFWRGFLQTFIFLFYVLDETGVLYDDKVLVSTE